MEKEVESVLKQILTDFFTDDDRSKTDVKPSNSDNEENSKTNVEGKARDGVDCNTTTDNSSGFEDLSTTKATVRNSSPSNDDFPPIQVDQDENGDSNDSDHSSSCHQIKIYTSTPIKGSDAGQFGEEDDELIVDNDSTTHETLLEDLRLKDDKDEYLNETIDEAIDKYEKSEKTFKDAFAQTTFNESAEKFCCPCSKGDKLKSNERNELILKSPPVKKFKEDKKEEENGGGDKAECNGGDALTGNSKTTERVSLIINKFQGVTGMNQTNDVPVKTPRIRVGLSKRARIRARN